MAAVNPRLPFAGTTLKRRLDSSPISLFAARAEASAAPLRPRRQPVRSAKALPRLARKVGHLHDVPRVQARRAGPARANGVDGADSSVLLGGGGVFAGLPAQPRRRGAQEPKRCKRARRGEPSPSTTRFVDVFPSVFKTVQPGQRSSFPRLRRVQHDSSVVIRPMHAAGKSNVRESQRKAIERENEEGQEEEEEEEAEEEGGEEEHEQQCPVAKINLSAAVLRRRSQADMPNENDDDRALLIDGAIDIYGDPRGPLWKHRPRARPKGLLEVHALPLRRADEDLRKSVEVVLHSACSDPDAMLAISHLLGLSLNGMGLRSGRQTSRCQVDSTKDDFHLIWEEVRRDPPIVTNDRRAVGALILRQPPSCRSGAVVAYVCTSRSLGGAGWPMVCAAEELCRLDGKTTLYSAADLEQDGRWGNRHDSLGRGISALEAHERWRFENSSPKEWKAAGLELYNSKTCRVRYMKKHLAFS